MHALRLVGFAGIALLLVSGCRDSPPAQPMDAQPTDAQPVEVQLMDAQEQEQMLAVLTTLCSQPPGKPGTIPIPVKDDATVDTTDFAVWMRWTDDVLWSLTEKSGTKLRIIPYDPTILKVKELDDWRVEGKPNRGAKSCEALSYKIEVLVDGIPVEGDPILIIRD